MIRCAKGWPRNSWNGGGGVGLHVPPKNRHREKGYLGVYPLGMCVHSLLKFYPATIANLTNMNNASGGVDGLCPSVFPWVVLMLLLLFCFAVLVGYTRVHGIQ